MMKVQTSRDLVVWQKAVDMVEVMYLKTKKFPTEERYGLTSQLRRAAVSVAANIAEGYGRANTSEYVQFLWISYASGCEVETLVEVSTRVGLIDEVDGSALIKRVDEIQRMTRSLIRALRSQKHEK